MADDKKSRLMADLFGDKSAEPSPAKPRTMLDDILSGKQTAPAAAEATPPRQRTMLEDILSGKPASAPSAAEATPPRQRGMFDDLLGAKPSAPAPTADSTPSRPRSMFDDILSGKPSTADDGAAGDVSLGGYEPSASRPGRRGRQRAAAPADPLDLFSPKPPSSPARAAPAAAAPPPPPPAAPPPPPPAADVPPPQPAAAAASWMDSLGVTPTAAAAAPPVPAAVPAAVAAGAARPQVLPGPDIAAQAAREKELTEEWAGKLADANRQIAEKESEIIKLKSGCTAHQLERERLEEHIALLNRMAEDERKQLENSFQHRLAVTDESYQRREKQLMDENNRLRDEFRDRLKRYQEETSWATSSHLRHLSAIEGVQSAELGRLRDTYEQSLAGLRAEHEAVVARLVELRDAERRQDRSAGHHSGMLDDAIQQLQKTSDVTEDLMARVSHRYDVTLQARETLLKEREQQLKDTETKLDRLQRDTASEREHLQELITKLQHNLDTSSAETKEATLRLQQQQARVEARETALDRERTGLLERVEQERHQIERLRQELLEEQRHWLLEVNAERHEIAAAHARLDARLRLAGLGQQARPDGARFVPDHQPTAAELDGMYQALAEDRSAVEEQRRQLTALQAEAKQAVLAADSREQAMTRELERLQSQAQLLKLKSQEVDDVSEMAVRSREEGQRALQEAQELRQQLTKSQLLLERQQAKLRAQERLIAQERAQLVQQRQTAAAATLSGTRGAAAPEGGPASCRERTLGDGAAGGPELVPVDPAILLWRLRADEDREFLDREAAFIKQLTSPS